MTYISSSKNLQGKVERHEQRHLALRTVENNDSGLELQSKYDINKLRIDMNEKLEKLTLISYRRIDE